MLKLATKQGLLHASPAEHIEYPTHGLPTFQRRVLTSDEYATLVAAAESLRDRTLIRALCEAGLRRAEAVGLEVGDLDLDQGYINVKRRIIHINGTTDTDTPKGRRIRTVAISDTLRNELAWMLLDRPDAADPTAPVWIGTHPKQPKRITGSGVRYVVEKTAEKAGLVDSNGKTWVTPHTLRASGASIAVASGVSPLVAQNQLGHASLQTTARHYLHLGAVEQLKGYAEVFG